MQIKITSIVSRIAKATNGSITFPFKNFKYAQIINPSDKKALIISSDSKDITWSKGNIVGKIIRSDDSIEAGKFEIRPDETPNIKPIMYATTYNMPREYPFTDVKVRTLLYCTYNKSCKFGDKPNLIRVVSKATYPSELSLKPKPSIAILEEKDGKREFSMLPFGRHIDSDILRRYNAAINTMPDKLPRIQDIAAVSTATETIKIFEKAAILINQYWSELQSHYDKIIGK